MLRRLLASSREGTQGERKSDSEALLRLRSPLALPQRRIVRKQQSADRSIPSIFSIATGEGVPRLFSQWLTVGNVTPNLAANFSRVSPKCCRRSRIELSISSCRPATNIIFASLYLPTGR